MRKRFVSSYKLCNSFRKERNGRNLKRKREDIGRRKRLDMILWMVLRKV